MWVNKGNPQTGLHIFSICLILVYGLWDFLFGKTLDFVFNSKLWLLRKTLLFSKERFRYYSGSMCAVFGATAFIASEYNTFCVCLKLSEDISNKTFGTLLQGIYCEHVFFWFQYLLCFYNIIFEKKISSVLVGSSPVS